MTGIDDEFNTLSLVGVGKRFGGVPALAGVSLDCHPGDVLGLVGANGAGKSTLIKILTGYFTHYEGQIVLGGRSVRLVSPAHARAAGIEAVYQDVNASILPGLSVADNLLLNRLARGQGGVLLQRRAREREALEVAARVGLDLDPRAPAGSLSLHQKQMLLIARAMAQRTRFLILDEPTAALSLQECERLFALIEQLQRDGVGIVYVSHRLQEIEQICSRVVVLRNGQLVASFDAHAPAHTVAAEILGAPPEVEFPPVTTDPPLDSPPALAARNLRAGPRVRGISLEARRGEILALTGLVGAGKTEVLRAIFGADRIQGGEIVVDGVPMRMAGPGTAVAHGIYLIPEERAAQALYLDLSAGRNLTSTFLGRLSRFGIMRRHAERSEAARLATRLDVRGDIAAPVATLSGGNQQKIVLGKWLAGNPRVLLLDEATQGVDIGTRRQIYIWLRLLAETAAVIYATSDIDEAIGLADRLLVLRDGTIVGEFTRATMHRAQIVELASGARWEQGA